MLRPLIYTSSCLDTQVRSKLITSVWPELKISAEVTISLNDFGMSLQAYVIWIISLLLDNGKLLEYNFPVS